MSPVTPPLIRCIGGALMTEAGPITLQSARLAADWLRSRLAEVSGALEAAERWRRAAGWDEPDAADARP